MLSNLFSSSAYGERGGYSELILLEQFLRLFHLFLESVSFLVRFLRLLFPTTFSSYRRYIQCISISFSFFAFSSIFLRFILELYNLSTSVHIFYF